jgi:hypothetical protein
LVQVSSQVATENTNRFLEHLPPPDHEVDASSPLPVKQLSFAVEMTPVTNVNHPILEDLENIFLDLNLPSLPPKVPLLGDFLISKFIDQFVKEEQISITFKFCVMLLAMSTGSTPDQACEV